MIRIGNMAEISRLIALMGSEVKSIVKSAFEISYWGRGAWSYESVMKMSAAERALAIEFIDDRFDKAKQSKTFQTFF